MNSKFFVLFGLILFATRMSAQEFTMSAAVRHALDNNRDLKALYFSIDQARARLIQAGKWPNPELEFAFASDFAFKNEGENALNVGIMQPIPVAGRLRFAQQVQRVDVAKAIAEIRNKERLIIGETQSAFLTAMAVQEKLISIQAGKTVAQKDIDLVRQRVASGQSSVADVSLANVTSLKFRQETATMNAELNSALLDLKLLMGLPPETPITIQGSLEAAASRLQRPARKFAVRPDLTLKELDQDTANAEVALAKAEAWEDIKVGVEYDYGNTMDEPDGLTREEMIGFRISVPLPVWNRNQGRIAVQKASGARANAEALALRLQIEKETVSARKRAAGYREAIQIYQKETEPALGEAEQQLGASYASGSGNLRDILMVRSQRAELRSQYVASYLQYLLALNELETALGANPQLPLEYLEVSPSKNAPKKER